MFKSVFIDKVVSNLIVCTAYLFMILLWFYCFNNYGVQSQLLLFNFHNHVNRKLKKPVFELSELDNKYSKANINALYNNFFIITTIY